MNIWHRARHALSAVAAVLAIAPAAAQDTGSGADDDTIAGVRAATSAWIEAFNTRDARRIAALYAPDAVFWGTISPTIRITPDAVLTYFEDSARRRPLLRMELGETHVRVFGETALNSGYYTSVDTKDGAEVRQSLRFTFVYRRDGDRWSIVSHHSSRMPVP